MPDVYQHLRQAVRNDRFVTSLGDPHDKWSAWAVVGLFYTALHFVTALLHVLGCGDEDVNTHGKRLSQLKQRLPNDQQLFDDYGQLLADSVEARYKCRNFTGADIAELQNQQFGRVKARVKQLLS
jgi:hypothetical protein